MDDIEHTFELQSSQEEASRVAEALRENGWEIYNERVPLSAQFGYYCTRVVMGDSGQPVRQAHSVRWNLFGEPLIPAPIDCVNDSTLLSFLWQHGSHENFAFFASEDDLGFVCYCHGGALGYSTVLWITPEFAKKLSPRAYDLLQIYLDSEDLADEDDEIEDEDDEEEFEDD